MALLSEAALPEAGAGGNVERADAFISYSRGDQAFVEEVLLPALEAHGKHVWLDLKDIPPAADWRDRINAGIQAARALVFVISPTSMASGPCREELEHAVSLNKPLVPIVRADVPSEELPPALERRDWIFLRESDPVEAGVEEVVAALETDLEWRDLHNELAVRAHDWVAGNRDRSLLLRGRALAEAERWEDDPGPHRESPTAEQAAFIHAGRRAATRRQREVVVAVGVALVVSVGLAVFALVQRGQAIAREKTATSLALASAADRQPVGGFDAALLLSLQAYRTSPTIQATSSMLSALEVARSSHPEAVLHSGQGSVGGIAFSKDGTLATAGGGTVSLWDARTHRRLGEPIHGDQGAVLDLAFSPDGHMLATAGDAKVVLWDARTHERLGRPLDSHLDAVLDMAFSRDGHTLATTGQSGTVRFWSTRTHLWLGNNLRAFRGEGSVYDAVLSSDSRRLATIGFNGPVLLWDARTHLGRPLVGKAGIVRGAVFARDGGTLATIRDRTVLLWDVQTGAPLGRSYDGHQGSVSGVAFSPDGHTLAVGAGADGTVQLWDTRDHHRLAKRLAGHQARITSIAFGPDGHTLATAGSDGKVLLRDIRSRLGQPLGGTLDGVRSIAFSPDGHTLASGGKDGKLRFWRARTHLGLGQPLDGRQGAVHGVAFSPDGQTVATGGEDGTVRFWNARTHSRLGQPLDVGQGAVHGVAFSPDGHTLASAGQNGTVKLWDVRTRKVHRRHLKNNRGPIHGVAFSQDGHTLVASFGDGGRRSLVAWDTRARPRDSRSLDGPGDDVYGDAFSPDGHTFAAAYSAGAGAATVRFWDSRTFTSLGQPLRSQQGPLTDVAFSPDGHTLATAGGNGTVRLWDMRTRVQLGQSLNGHQGAVDSVVFSPDGHTLATVGHDGTVLLWDGILWRDRDDLKALVCSLVFGNLTQDEWEIAAPDLPRRTTCPD